MRAIYLIGVFIFLLTEYGFRTRRKVLTAFASYWDWKTALLRTTLWLIFLGITGWYQSWTTVRLVLAFILAGEIAAIFFRFQMKATIDESRMHGRPWVHLLPFLLALLYPLVMASGNLIGQAQLTSKMFEPKLKLLLIANGIVILWSWSNLFVISVVEAVRAGQVKEEIKPPIGAGEIIGILERYITFILVAYGIGAVAGFVMTAKTVVRFPQFQHKEFAEYYLIGTLTSVGIAVLLGLLLTKL